MYEEACQAPDKSDQGVLEAFEVLKQSVSGISSVAEMQAELTAEQRLQCLRTVMRDRYDEVSRLPTHKWMFL